MTPSDKKIVVYDRHWNYRKWFYRVWNYRGVILPRCDFTAVWFYRGVKLPRCDFTAVWNYRDVILPRYFLPRYECLKIQFCAPELFIYC